MSVGVRLRTAIERRQWTIRGFHKAMEVEAERAATGGEEIAGTSYPAIHRYLAKNPKAESLPSLSFLFAAARVLGVRPAWLILGEGQQTEEEERYAAARAARAAWAADVELRIAREQDETNRLVARIIAEECATAEQRDTAHGMWQQALLRFAAKLDDAEQMESPWGHGTLGREKLLRAAARFLIGVERLAGEVHELTTDESRRTQQDTREFYRNQLWLAESDAPGWQVVWSDAVLELFSRRVFGLGERTSQWMDRHVREFEPKPRPHEAE